MSMRSLIERTPKSELHVHIEGCLEPDLVLKLAERNNLQHKLPYKTLAEAEAAFQYDNLQEFLDLRDATLQVQQTDDVVLVVAPIIATWRQVSHLLAQVLMTEQDFYEVTMLYLGRVAAQNVIHTEIFFDPQVHTMRDVGFETFMPGLIRGIKVTQALPARTISCYSTVMRHESIQDGGSKYGLTAGLLMCFMTELGPSDAESCLQQVISSCFSSLVFFMDEGDAPSCMPRGNYATSLATVCTDKFC